MTNAVNLAQAISNVPSLQVGTTTNNGERARINFAGAIGPATSGNMTSGLILQAGDGSGALNLGSDGSGQWSNSAYANNAGVALSQRFLIGGTQQLIMTGSGNVWAASSTSPTLANAVGVMYSQSNCKAWVVYNSAGTIVNALNVSSVTRNGTGNFTVNFANAFANPVLCTNVTTWQSTSTSGVSNNVGMGGTTTTSVPITNYENNTSTNPSQTFVTVFAS